MLLTCALISLILVANVRSARYGSPQKWDESDSSEIIPKGGPLWRWQTLWTCCPRTEFCWRSATLPCGTTKQKKPFASLGGELDVSQHTQMSYCGPHSQTECESARHNRMSFITAILYAVMQLR